MLKITKPTNQYEEMKLISMLKNTLPQSFEVYIRKNDVTGDMKIYLEDREDDKYGKYSSGLVHVHNIDTLQKQFEGELQENIETPDWVDGRKGFSTTLYEGVFSYEYIKKTGSSLNLFDYTQPEATHALFKVNWGGANSPSRGFINPPEFEDNLTYLKRAESNGKGRGLTYVIIAKSLLDEME